MLWTSAGHFVLVLNSRVDTQPLTSTPNYCTYSFRGILVKREHFEDEFLSRTVIKCTCRTRCVVAGAAEEASEAGRVPGAGSRCFHGSFS